MEKAFWKAIVQDLIDSGESTEEIVQILSKQYPNRTDIVSLVNESVQQKVDDTKAKIRSFTKQAQDFGFGYQNPGPSNFNVPDPQGGSGAHVQIDATPSTSTPSGSYTDKLKMRKEQREKRKEEERKEKERAEMLAKLSAAKPGEILTNLTKKTQDVSPGEIIDTLDDVESKVETLDTASQSSSKQHSPSPETKRPIGNTGNDQPKTTTTPKTTSNTSTSTKDVENLNKATDKAQKSVDKLKDTLSRM